MSFTRYEHEDLPARLSRIVRWRWPGERLVLTVFCDAEWPVVEHEWAHDDPSIPSGHDADRPTSYRVESGALGVTEARLVYRNPDRPGYAVRLAAIVFVSLGTLGFLAGDPSLMAPAIAAIAALLWLAAHLMEALGVGSGVVAFGRVLGVDRDAGRILGVDGWGIHYRLRLDRSDFEQVARLVARYA